MQFLQPHAVARQNLKRGDHIFAYRHSYLPCHGIYDGEGQVIHFISSPSEYSSIAQCTECGDHPNPNRLGVTKHCLRCFLAGAGTVEPYLFQYGVLPTLFLARTRRGTCSLARSDPPDAVMRRALQLLQSDAVSTYGSFFVKSCEDFAVYCKTGLLVMGDAPRSGHAAAALTAATAVAASPLRSLLGFAGSAFVGLGVHCLSRLAEDITVRRDVVKDAVAVPVDMLIGGSVPSL